MILIISLVLMALSTASLAIGVADLSWDILWYSRIPRLCAIILAGSGLSIAGFIMQQITQNRFAAPSTAGTMECAMFGYMLSLVYSPWATAAQSMLIIFGSALLGTFLFVRYIQYLNLRHTILVPLIGIIFGQIIAALALFIAQKHNALQSLNAWTVGNFSSILQHEYELLYIIIPLIVGAYYYASQFSAIGLGKDFSVNLGIHFQATALLGISLVALISSAVMIVVGKLPFIGLIIPNLVRYFYGDHLRQNLPYILGFGASLALGGDLLARLIIFPFEVPIALIMSILGSVIFIFFILRQHEKI